MAVHVIHPSSAWGAALGLGSKCNLYVPCPTLVLDPLHPATEAPMTHVRSMVAARRSQERIPSLVQQLRERPRVGLGNEHYAVLCVIVRICDSLPR